MEGAGLKPLQLANACGVSSGAVTHWLNGATKHLKAESALMIENATGYCASWLITGTGEKLKLSTGSAFIDTEIPTPAMRSADETYRGRLAALMAERGISRTQLATKLGISYQGVRKVFDSDGAFGSENNLRAADYFEVNPRWLATGEGREKTSHTGTSAAQVAWPFDLAGLTRARYESLPVSSRYAVQAFMLQAIEKQEAALNRVD